MNGVGISRKLRWSMLPAAIGALLLAACAQATPTAAPTVLVPTGPPTASLAPTGAVVATQAGTSSTPAASGTQAAMGQGTPQPSGALLIDSNRLIGLPVVDLSNNPAGLVADVLVDTSGTIKSVVLNVNGTAAGVGTPAASETPAATAGTFPTAGAFATTGASGTTGPFATANPLGSTGAVATLDAIATRGAVAITGAIAPAVNVAAPGGTGAVSTAATPAMNAAGYVIVDWTQFSPDPANNRLVYQGSASTLMGSQAFDELSVCGALIMPGGAGASLFAGMWRLAAPLSMVTVQDMTGASVGGLQAIILDLTKGQALYAVLNVNGGTPSASTPIASSGVSGACPNSPGTGSAGTTVGTMAVVPFANLSVSTANAASANPPVIVQAPSTKVQAAPNLNSIQLSMWPQMAQPGWNSQINSYWGIAGS